MSRLLILAGAALLALPAFAADKEVEPVQEIKGALFDNKDLPKLKEMPASNLLTDEKAFAKLWASWRAGDPQPKVDFKKQFVYVVAREGGFTKIIGGFNLKDGGDLMPFFAFSEAAGPGFIFKMFILDREGIKTIGGKPLP
jgi:hypothetical protein